jgi:hypothetical protein
LQKALVTTFDLFLILPLLSIFLESLSPFFDDDDDDDDVELPLGRRSKSAFMETLLLLSKSALRFFLLL